MPKSPHTTFPKGSPVFVKLKDGTKFEDNWEDKKGRYVYFRNHDRVRTSEIKAMTFRKLKADDDHGFQN